MATSVRVASTQERFLSDNPFRMLGTGSAEALSALRRKADGAAKAAKVGLVQNIPMSELLGASDLAELPQLIRGLVNDAKRKTCFRIMWPLSQEGIPFMSQGGTVRSGQFPGEELAQLLFLSSWLAYLEGGSPGEAADAFERWEELYTNEAMDERLVGLLVEEDGLSRDSAYDIVLDAQRAVALTILNRVSSDAASAWDAGQTSKGAQLIEAVLNSPIDDDLEELALEPIADSAHRLKERVEGAIKGMAEWRRGGATDPPKEVVQLERISGAMRGRLPAAKDWEETAHRWTTALVWRMRQESLRLNHGDDNAGALDVIRAALKLANTSEQKTKLRDDLSQLEKIVAEEKAEAAYAGIERISSAPSLGTLNGFGTKVYGREPFPPDRSLYFTVLYFTAVFIPVFPLARYLVKDGAGGGWHFLGRTSWTQGMKVHLAVSCFLILFFCIYVANNDSAANVSSTSSEAGSSTSSYSPPSYTAPESTESFPSSQSEQKPQTEAVAEQTGPTSNSDTEERSNIDYDKWIAEQDAKQKKREGLERELEELKTEISSLKSEIGEEGAALDEQRSTLDNLKAEIDASEPNRYSQEEIDAYNAKVDRYESLRAEFNDAVQSYNRKVNLQKKKVRRHNEIVDALNASR